jgi:hypothetical protein
MREPIKRQVRRFVNNTRDDLLGLISSATGRIKFSLDPVHIDVVSGCQLRCPGCPNSTLRRNISYMPVGDFARCLQNIDVKHICVLRVFNYGEPLLHPQLPDILNQIPQQSWSVNIVEISTNAQTYDEEQLIALFKTKVLTSLVVSCDGNGTAQDYERLRPPAQWSKLLTFLKGVKEIKETYAPSVVLSTRTCCDDPIGRDRWETLLQPLGWKPAFRSYMALPEAPLPMASQGLVVPKGVCSWLRPRRLFVDFDGIVVPCCAHPRAFELGDLNNETYSQIFFGKKRKEFIARLKQNRKNMPLCGACGQP